MDKSQCAVIVVDVVKVSSPGKQDRILFQEGLNKGDIGGVVQIVVYRYCSTISNKSLRDKN